MISKTRIKDLEKQGYRLVGNHSAVKVCMWTKRAIKNEDFCYKQKFYGINSHRCVQMTPSLPFCSQRCVFCWRDIAWTESSWKGKIDSPKILIENCIKEQRKILQGFGGNKKADKIKFYESQRPLHFAISLSGEPTSYPKLQELIMELKKRKITSFLVTNGTNPDMLKKLLKTKSLPTQLYITLPAPNEKIYKKVCNPLVENGWEKINESLKLLEKFNRPTIRMTLVKDLNLTQPEEYSRLIKMANPDFLELKSYMWVGYSRERLEKEKMPSHAEIKEFAKKIAKLTSYKIIDEKENSRVVLLMKKGTKDRIMEF